jgi:hypothetical protein
MTGDNLLRLHKGPLKTLSGFVLRLAKHAQKQSAKSKKPLYRNGL